TRLSSIALAMGSGQYNGFMYGIMIASMVAARNGQPLLCGALFAILLCFKHIYLYLAPAYLE
ncbi:hypothetical protein, partial [Klebsiella aerogenes]|uniref:hypothetical protein n=1 Tax=Klebsiella aerogenes TaxID=548 RepID=UPI0019538D45